MIDYISEIGLVFAVEVVNIPVTSLKEEGEHNIMLIIGINDFQLHNGCSISNIAYLLNLMSEISADILSTDPVIVVKENVVSF
jgi:hypothetical protein